MYTHTYINIQNNVRTLIMQNFVNTVEVQSQTTKVLTDLKL